MRLLKLTALTGMSLLLLAFFVGCGSDDKPTTTTPSYGNNTDPDFVPVQDEINGLLVEIVDDMLDGFDNLYVTPGDTVNARADLSPSWLEPDPVDGPDTLIAIYQNDWYFVYASYTGDIYRSRLWDSVQFQNDGTAQQSANNADYIHFIDNWEVTSLNQDVTHSDFSGRNDYVISHLDENIATIEGATEHNVNAVYVGTDTTMTLDYEFTSVATDIQIAKFVTGWHSACPVSGTIDMTMTNDFAWTNASSSGQSSVSWEIDVTFSNGTATIYADNGTVTWRYTCEVCTVPGVTE
ncbi:MAG: hypothetical protein GY841_17665 [FCB group bacterium]|nr:hypothetical protein [FCB group bacterium]